MTAHRNRRQAAAAGKAARNVGTKAGASAATKAEATRGHLLDTALRLFRRRGFERATMRDIAGAAGMSLGAAYYHFRSKEDLVHSYYQWMQDEHERLLRAQLPGLTRLEDRLRAAFRTKLDLVVDNRAFLGALFRFTGEPDHPLSVFSDATGDVRRRSIATFALALGGAGLSGATAELAVHGLWGLHLALLLRAIYDRSPGMAKTYALAAAAADLVARLAVVAESPAAVPLVGWLVQAIGAELDLTPTPPPPPASSSPAPRPRRRRAPQPRRRRTP